MIQVTHLHLVHLEIQVDRPCHELRVFLVYHQNLYLLFHPFHPVSNQYTCLLHHLSPQIGQDFLERLVVLFLLYLLHGRVILELQVFPQVYRQALHGFLDTLVLPFVPFPHRVLVSHHPLEVPKRIINSKSTVHFVKFLQLLKDPFHQQDPSVPQVR